MTDAIDLDHLGSQLERVLAEQDRIRVSAAAASAGASARSGAPWGGGQAASGARRQAPGTPPETGRAGARYRATLETVSSRDALWPRPPFGSWVTRRAETGPSFCHCDDWS